MATIYRFEELEIWQLARKLYQKTSKLSDKLKKNHDFRFADQMKAAAGSIMDNTAEGFERSSLLEFLNSLSIAKRECGELKSQFYRCLDDGYIAKEEFDEYYMDTDQLCTKIAGLIKYLNSTTFRGLKFKGRLENNKL